MGKERISPARQLVQLVWDNASRDSWRTLNESMAAAVALAIGAGLRFAKGDVEHFAKTMRMHYWHSVEGVYGAAAAGGNISACQSVEALLKREPFIYEGARIYVGRNFVWQGEAVTCTSIDGESLIACSYHNGRNGKIKRRYTVTLAEVQSIGKASRAEKKAAKDAKEQAVREAEEARLAKEEEWRKQREEQERQRIEEKAARLAALQPEVLTRTTTVEEAVAANLCREGVIDFCDRYLGGRRAATVQEAIDAVKGSDGRYGGVSHYLDSIEVLIAHLGRIATP